MKGRCEKLLDGGTRAEFTWPMRRSIATDHYLFQGLKAMLFSYLQAVGAGGQAWLLELAIR